VKTFLFLGGLLVAILFNAYCTAFLINLGLSEVFCYFLYLVGLAIITGAANYVNSQIFGWYDDEYKPLDYYNDSCHHLTK